MKIRLGHFYLHDYIVPTRLFISTKKSLLTRLFDTHDIRYSRVGIHIQSTLDLVNFSVSSKIFIKSSFFLLNLEAIFSNSKNWSAVKSLLYRVFY